MMVELVVAPTLPRDGSCEESGSGFYAAMQWCPGAAVGGKWADVEERGIARRQVPEAICSASPLRAEAIVDKSEARAAAVR